MSRRAVIAENGPLAVRAAETAGRLDLSGAITARYPLAQAAEAIQDLATRRGNPVHLVLVPGATA